MPRIATACSLALLFTSLSGTALTSHAQSVWQWRDSQGHMEYSDTPPPRSVAPANIVQAPGRFAGAFRAVEPVKASDTPDAKPARDALAGKPRQPAAAVNPDEAFRERRLAALKADADQAAAQQDAAERQARCTQMQNYATALQQNSRAAVAGADGSLQHLDAAQRQVELEQTSAAYAKQCV